MKFSVLMPLFNHERFVGEAIESVLKQTYSNWELVVCDDGSTDNSANEVRKFQDNRIKLIQKQNEGVSSALNHAIIHSTGDVLTWLSSDDFYASQKLATHASYHQNGAKISLLPAASLDMNGEVKPYSLSRTPDAQQRLLYFFLSHNYVNGIAIAFNRSMVGNVGFFSPRYRYAQDEDYWIRLIKQAPIAYGESLEPFSYSRMGTTSVSIEGEFFRALDSYIVLYENIIRRGPLAMVPIEFENSTPAGLLKQHILSLLKSPSFRLNSVFLQDQVVLQFKNWLQVRNDYSISDRDSLSAIIEESTLEDIPVEIKQRFNSVNEKLFSKSPAPLSCIDIREHIWTLLESGVTKAESKSVRTYLERLSNI